jgi:hypothetical protein
VKGISPGKRTNRPSGFQYQDVRFADKSGTEELKLKTISGV